MAPCCIKAAAAGEGKQRVARRNAAREPSSGAFGGHFPTGQGGTSGENVGKTWEKRGKNGE